MSSSVPYDEDTAMDWEEDVPATRKIGGYVVLDTNIVISHYAWIKASCGIIWGPGSETLPSNMGMIVLAIPWTVLRELDKLKITKGLTNHELGANVRRANRILFEMLSRRDGSIIGQKSWEKTDLGKDPSSVNDDKILDYCLYLSNKTKLRVALISNDTNLLAKTSIYGIAALDWDNVVKSSGTKVMEETRRIEKEYKHPPKGQTNPPSQQPQTAQQEQKQKPPQNKWRNNKSKPPQPQGQPAEKPQKPTPMSIEKKPKHKGPGQKQNSVDVIVTNISPIWDSLIRPNQAPSPTTLPLAGSNPPSSTGISQQSQIQPFNQQNKLQVISKLFSQPSQSSQHQLFGNSLTQQNQQVPLQPFGNSLAQQSQVSPFQPYDNTVIAQNNSTQLQMFNNPPPQQGQNSSVLLRLFNNSQPQQPKPATQIQSSSSSTIQFNQTKLFNLFSSQSNGLTQQSQSTQFQLFNNPPPPPPPPQNQQSQPVQNQTSTLSTIQSIQIKSSNIFATETNTQTPAYSEGSQSVSSGSFMQLQASQELSASKTQGSSDQTTTQSLKRKREVKHTAAIVTAGSNSHSKKFTKAATEVKKAEKVESSTSELSRKSKVVTHTKEIKKIVMMSIKTHQDIIDLTEIDSEPKSIAKKEAEKKEVEKKAPEEEEVKPKRKLVIIRPEKKKKEEEVKKEEEKVKEKEEVKPKKKLNIVRPEKGAVDYSKKLDNLVVTFVVNVSDIIIDKLDSGCLKGVFLFIYLDFLKNFL